MTRLISHLLLNVRRLQFCMPHFCIFENPSSTFIPSAAAMWHHLPQFWHHRIFFQSFFNGVLVVLLHPCILIKYIQLKFCYLILHRHHHHNEDLLAYYPYDPCCIHSSILCQWRGDEGNRQDCSQAHEGGARSHQGEGDKKRSEDLRWREGRGIGWFSKVPLPPQWWDLSLFWL